MVIALCEVGNNCELLDALQPRKHDENTAVAFPALRGLSQINY